MPYAALRALEESTVVHIVETLKYVQKLKPTNARLRGLGTLELHRHAVSHPAKVKWETAEMQAFFDQGRRWKNFPPALVWDLQRSINEALRTAGLKPYNEDISVTADMAQAGSSNSTAFALSLAIPRPSFNAMPSPVQPFGSPALHALSKKGIALLSLPASRSAS
jgi:hypothetical protein